MNGRITNPDYQKFSQELISRHIARAVVGQALDKLCMDFQARKEYAEKMLAKHDDVNTANR